MHQVLKPLGVLMDVTKSLRLNLKQYFQNLAYTPYVHLNYTGCFWNMQLLRQAPEQCFLGCGAQTGAIHNKYKSESVKAFRSTLAE